MDSETTTAATAPPHAAPAGDSAASSELTLRSLAFQHNKARHYAQIDLDDRSNYFGVSCKPICKRAEDDMELISDVVLQCSAQPFLHPAVLPPPTFWLLQRR